MTNVGRYLQNWFLFLYLGFILHCTTSGALGAPIVGFCLGSMLVATLLTILLYFALECISYTQRLLCSCLILVIHLWSIIDFMFWCSVKYSVCFFCRQVTKILFLLLESPLLKSFPSEKFAYWLALLGLLPFYSTGWMLRTSFNAISNQLSRVFLCLPFPKQRAEPENDCCYPPPSKIPIRYPKFNDTSCFIL